MYVYRNNETRSCNHCCSGKAMSVTQPACVFVCSTRYPACNAHAPYRHLWPAPFYSIFPHYLIKGTIFEKKSTENIMYFFYSLYYVCLKHFLF